MSEHNTYPTEPSTNPRQAVVTGASTGIGEHTVCQLRDLGWKVIAVARRQDRLLALAAETGCDFYAADQVYAGVDAPLLGEDIADAIGWALTRPAHVNIDSMIVRPRAQANNLMVARNN